jgi:hypothetical protein
VAIVAKRVWLSRFLSLFTDKPPFRVQTELSPKAKPGATRMDIPVAIVIIANAEQKRSEICIFAFLHTK